MAEHAHAGSDARPEPPRSRSVWTRSRPLVLASGSRTRRTLLVDAGIDPEIVAPDVDERAIEAGSGSFSPVELAACLARAKALAVASRMPERVVLGADQVLELDGDILHKAGSEMRLRAQLARLQGRTHRLHSAAAVAWAGNLALVQASAALTMRSLDDNAIERYVALAGADRLAASVGGYQIEGLGLHLFERIEGDHATILGLPLLPVLAQLRSMECLAF